MSAYRYRPRICLRCGILFALTSGTQQRCPPCQKQRRLVMRRASAKRWRAKNFKRHREHVRTWRNVHREAFRAYRAQYERRRRAQKPPRAPRVKLVKPAVVRKERPPTRPPELCHCCGRNHYAELVAMQGAL